MLHSLGRLVSPRYVYCCFPNCPLSSILLTYLLNYGSTQAPINLPGSNIFIKQNGCPRKAIFLSLGIKHFAAAILLRPELWTDETAIREDFSLMGNKDDYVDTLIAYMQSRRDFFNLWQRRILGGLSDLTVLPVLDSVAMSPEQSRINTLVEKFLSQRQEYYNDIPEADVDSDSDTLESDSECALDERNIQTFPSTPGHYWRKFLLVRGKPGTGKTYAVLHSIRKVLKAEYTLLCTTPTGMLSRTYNSIITDDALNADTIHSAFKYPVNPDERPVINWDLANYDLIVIDELSMTPSTVFDHILATLQELHVRPVVLLCGDHNNQLKERLGRQQEFFKTKLYIKTV